MHLRKLRKALFIVAGIYVSVIVILQVGLNLPFVTGLVNGWAEKNIDGEVRFSKIDFSFIRCFPKVRVTVDTLSLTYPHDMFSRYDGTATSNPLLERGRGEESDTLAVFDRFTASVNLWYLLAGKIRLSDAHLHSIGLFAHFYNDSTSNLGIFKFKSDSPDTSSSPRHGLPWISVGKVRVARNPEFIYTAQSDTVFAKVRFRNLEFGGDMKIGADYIRFRDLDFNLDSLFLYGRLPADTVGFALEHLDVGQCGRRSFNVSCGARALAFSSSLGRLDIPLRVVTGLDFDMEGEMTRLRARGLDANIAHIPLKAEALVELYPDKTFIDASLNARQCPLDTLLTEYARSVTDLADAVVTDARLDVSAEMKGCWAEGSAPDMKVSAGIPDCRVYYGPLDVNALFSLGAFAHIAPDGRIDASIDKLNFHSNGLGIGLSGSGSDVSGEEPLFEADAQVTACIDSLRRYLPSELELDVSGDVALNLKAKACLSELRNFKFEHSYINGRLDGNNIGVDFYPDSMKVRLYKPSVRISSDKTGVIAGIVTDSLFFSQGKGLLAKIRDMRNTARILKVEDARTGRMTPKIEIENSESGVFLKAGANKLGLRGARVYASVRRKVRDRSRYRHFMDSLQRTHPGVSRKQLLERARLSRGNAPLPDFLREESFRSADINIALDSSVRRYLQRWIPEGRIELEKGFVAMPSLPLRTALRGLNGGFDGNTLSLDTLSLSCGSSDLSAKGHISGLAMALQRKGLLRLDLDVRSNRINANELLAALEQGKELVKMNVGDDDSENTGYIRDSIAGASSDSVKTGLVVVPANIIADIGVNARRVDYSDLFISPLTANVSVRERTVQIVNSSMKSNLGDVALDAFYSTRTKDNIYAGVNLDMSGMSANGIIKMLPVVDSLLPVLRSFKGDLDCSVAVTTKLDTNMNVVVPSIDGVVRIGGRNLSIDDAGPLHRITSLLLFRNKEHIDIDDMNVSCMIYDNRLEVFPFILGVDRYKLALHGMHGFDNTMNYHVSILKSPFLLRFGINAYGYTDNWRISFGKALYKDGVPVFSEQLDKMQVNIIDYIRNVYDRGGANPARKGAEEIERRREGTGYYAGRKSQALSEEEMLQIDSLHFANELEQMNNETLSEIDALLEESSGIYAAITYDGKIENKMEKLKKQSKKKNK